jgi:hypothetical protein
MTHHVTHISLRLGDNLAHLHFLRKLALAYPQHSFRHYAHQEYLAQLVDVVSDLPQIELKAFESNPSPMRWAQVPNEPSLNAWKNHNGFWETHPLKLQYGPFMVEHFRELAEKMDLTSPIHEPADLLFDYPDLKATGEEYDYDFLVVGSQPMSGQAPGYRPWEMQDLASKLRFNHKEVCEITLAGWTVTKIGRISQKCKHIIMVSTGPSWPTFNVWNVPTPRIIINEPERVDLTPNTSHGRNVAEVEAILREKGLL